MPLEIDPTHRHVIGLSVKPGTVEIARLNLPAEVRATATRLQELAESYEFDAAGEIVDQMLAELPEDTPS